MKTLSIIKRMKYISITILVMIYSFGFAQKVVLQPDGNEGLDASVFSLEPDANYGIYSDFIAFDWTFFGERGYGKSFIKFDLDNLPKNIEITSAKLSLYYSTSTNQGQAGENACFLKKVLSNWSEEEITWNNQPKVSDNEFIYLRKSTISSEDYLDIDITDLAQFWAKNPDKNFGLSMELENRVLFSSLKFFSSDGPSSGLRPKLIIEYTSKPDKVDCFSFQPDGNSGIDAFAFELEPNTNYGDYPDLISFFWSFFGVNGHGASLIKFDLDSLPKNREIYSARLDLKYNPNSTNSGQAGENASNIFLISENWNESFVNWNSLPLYDKNDYIILPTSDFPNQDYLNINITKFAKFWYENPSKNFGVLMKLRNEILYSSLKFSSSDHPNPLYRPKLTICFRTNTDTHDPQQELTTNEAIVFSNDFEITELIDNEMEVFDISGKKVCTILRNPLGQTKDLSLLVSGSYIGMIKNKMHVKYLRLIR